MEPHSDTPPPRRLALIASQGTLDKAYPPFVLGSTAVALGFEVRLFFTFYGLQLLKRDLDHVRLSPLANPALPMPVPLPALAAALPGMEGAATAMMKRKIERKGIASLAELRDACLLGGARFVACELSMQMFDLERADLLDEVEVAGAASFLEFAAEADVQLLV